MSHFVYILKLTITRFLDGCFFSFILQFPHQASRSEFSQVQNYKKQNPY